MAARDAALAPHGLVPLPAAGQRAALPAARAIGHLGQAGYTVAQTSAGFTVTDAAGRVVAATEDLAARRALAVWATAPVAASYRQVATG